MASGGKFAWLYQWLSSCCVCRLGARGVQAAAADPGAVRTNIYNNSPKLGKGFIKTMIDNCYAPPEDGAQVGAARNCAWSCHII